MRDEFTLEGHTTINGETFYTHDLEVAVEIEPDESACLASWYVARCYVETFQKRKRVWVRVPDTDPLFETIKDWAIENRDEALAHLWDEYTEDQPHRRAPSDYEEHGTYRVPL
jgi:hypothetical protein